MVDFTGDFFADGLGSKYSFQSYNFTFNKYVSLNEKQVLAYVLRGRESRDKYAPRKRPIDRRTTEKAVPPQRLPLDVLGRRRTLNADSV